MSLKTDQPIINQAIELIDKYSDFDEEMAYHLRNGYVLSTPTSFVLAEMKEDTLVVHFVIGSVLELLSRIYPLTPKWIMFEKNGKDKRYEYQKFLKRFNL